MRSFSIGSARWPKSVVGSSRASRPSVRSATTRARRWRKSPTRSPTSSKPSASSSEPSATRSSGVRRAKARSRQSSKASCSTYRTFLTPTRPTVSAENDNVEVRVWGDKPSFDFDVRDHVEVGTRLDILDFERAAKISGSRFVVLKGLGSRLNRALMQFMLDVHTTEHGYRRGVAPRARQRQRDARNWSVAQVRQRCVSHGERRGMGSAGRGSGARPLPRSDRRSSDHQPSRGRDRARGRLADRVHRLHRVLSEAKRGATARTRAA